MMYLRVELDLSVLTRSPTCFRVYRSRQARLVGPFGSALVSYFFWHEPNRPPLHRSSYAIQAKPHADIKDPVF